MSDMPLTHRIYKDFLYWRLLPGIYNRAAKAPMDPRKVVLIEMRGTELSDNYKLIADRLEKSGDYDIHVHFMRHAQVGKKEYFDNCKALLQDIATAPYVFLTDACNVTSCITPREGTQIIQLWHACGAFKKWGISTGDLQFGDSIEWKRRHPYYANLSLVSISSPDIAWAYIEAMDLNDSPEVVRDLGVSRTDVFFDEQWLTAARDAVYGVVPQAQGKKILLYAPTFRGSVRNATGPDALDICALKEELGDDLVLLIKHHPYVKHRPAIPQGCEEFAFDVSDELPIDKLLACADMCISDYSSIVFEYSLMRRPMAFFAYDIEDYNDWRGFYYDYDALTPGPICTTTEEIIDWVRACETGFDPSEVDAFREKFMSACDGHATDRILAEVFGEGAV